MAVIHSTLFDSRTACEGFHNAILARDLSPLLRCGGSSLRASPPPYAGQARHCRSSKISGEYSSPAKSAEYILETDSATNGL